MKHVILMAFGLCFATFPAIAQMYRWVSADGQVHYSSTPPSSESTNRLDEPKLVKKTLESLAAEEQATIDNQAKQTKQTKQTVNAIDQQQTNIKQADEKQAAYNQEAKQKAQQDESQVKAACNSMRKDLAVYQNYPRARVEVGGVVRRLTPEELNARIADLQKSIDSNCQGY